MGSAEKFCLRWNDFETNISGAFRELREDKDFFDVTLACDDDQVQAHKVIISACSPFFKTILKRNRHEHPLLYLKGVKYIDLVSILNFMYHGEVNVAQEELNTFLAVAEDLKVKGLTQNKSENKPVQGESNKQRIREISEQGEPAPPPKRPRPIGQTAPQTSSRNVVPSYSPPDEEIQEVVVPVKSEPPSFPAETNHTVAQPENETPFTTVAHMEQGGNAGGMVEYGEDYGDYGEYEQPDGGYDAVGMGMGHDGNKDLSSKIAEKTMKLMDSNNQVVWQCMECGKQWPKRSKCERHVETHIVGASVQCTLCAKMFKNRPCLDAHMLQRHRGERDIDIYGKSQNFKSYDNFFECH